ncbi:DctP family TRAP transporter solute-binding subunit [Ornithinimicrobium cryptoxanthini]|uniref:DctP family TRAP transporter solute-binding subunit n=1 Tax=Ornithinimicrobium cryptoxanthini TaxID=2934161 RepID=A0ABY4YHD9_9MICO|nr:DctP family TRAP transporter solute-binding subunit [Ornithinimicrobium cryptoxanthini]USQ76052.1 DctP family TRAP transporter solute-binding subunit [Ornithinimicrobium cryptoxanthini]
MTSRSLRTLAIVAVGALTLAGCGGARGGGDGGDASGGDGETFTLKFSHVTTDSTPKGTAAIWFEEELEKRTDGRIDVEVYSNSSLYGDKDEMQAVQQNSVQMLAPASAKFTTVAPALQVLDLPFLFDTPDDIPSVAAPDTEVGKAIYANDDLAAKNMKVLGLWDSGMKQIHSNNLTQKPADMEGKKYRIQPSDVLKSQIEAWGGSAEAIAFAEVYSALQQGVIDGGENTYSNIESQKMHTVQSNIAESNHGYIGYILVVNTDFFDSLPEDLQEILIETAEDASTYNRDNVVGLNQESKEIIEADGNTEINVWTDEERQAFKDVVVPSIYEQYRDVIGDDIVDELLANQ